MNSITDDPTPLRDRNRAATRESILQAVAKRLEHDGLAQLSFAEIAREAGIGESTAYRYFPSKEALLEAFWAWAPNAIGRDQLPGDFAELASRLTPEFAMFDTREPLIRGMLASPMGRSSRQQTRSARQQSFRDLVDREVGPMPAIEREQLCAAIQLLYSATTWAAFKDYWDMDGQAAGLAATQAIRSLLADARQRFPSPSTGSECDLPAKRNRKQK